MGLHDLFGHLQHKLWQKERSGVKVAVWLSTTKSWESTRVSCVQMECDIVFPHLDESYNFSLDLILFGGLSNKLWPRKVAGVQP